MTGNSRCGQFGAGAQRASGMVARRMVLTCAALIAAHSSLWAQEIDPALSGAPWRVLEIKGQAAAHGETLRFSHGSLAARTACKNTIAAAVKQAGRTLQISKRLITLLRCTKQNVAAETRYWHALGAVSGYAEEGDAVHLMNADNRVVLRLAK